MPTFSNSILNNLINVTYKANYIGDLTQPTSTCMGMCLDWIRRIKTGKFTPGQSIFGHGDPSGSKRANRLKKIADTHQIRSNIAGQFFKTAVSREEKDLIVKFALEDFNVNLKGTPENKWDDKIFTDTGMNTKLNAYETILTKVDAEIKKSSYQMSVLRKHSASIENLTYQQFQKDWEAQMLKQKSMQVPVRKDVMLPFTKKVVYTTTENKTVNYTEKRTHNFNSIKIASQFVYASSSASYDGTGLFQDSLSGDIKKLSPKEGAILSLGKDLGQGVGHDLAFYNDGKSTYFFDPNLGEFLFDNSKIDSDFKNLFIGVFDIVYKSKLYTWSAWNTYQ
jgi:hypothetical protein